MIGGGQSESAMHSYEIRLLAGDGGVTMIHLMACGSVDEASARARAIGGVSYDRYEIWQGPHKVAEGRAP